MPEQEMATEVLSRSLAAARDVIAGVRPDQWDAPTPCEEWNVRHVVSHLVLGNRRHAALVRGEQIGPRPAGPPADVLGDDALATYSASAEEVLSAFGSPQVASTIYDTPIGRIPGSGVLHLRATDAVVHGWDVARATGQSIDAPDFVVAELLTFARTRLADAPPNGPFKPALAVPEGAPVLDQLVALLGRRP
jgi:uncharacterized protein (TIGR03086 family)